MRLVLGVAGLQLRRAREPRPAALEVALHDLDHAGAVLHLRPVRLEAEGQAVQADGLGQVALVHAAEGEVVERHRVLGPQRVRRLEVGDGLVHAAEQEEGSAQVHLRFRIARADAQRLLQVGQGLGGPVELVQVVGQVLVGHVVVAGDGQRAPEQRLAVLPVHELAPRLHHARGQEQRGHARGGPAPDGGPRGQRVRGQPDERDPEPDEGHVRVPVGQGLEADLHEADDRDQHAREPGPADEEVRTARAGEPGQRAEPRQQDGRARDGRDAERSAGMRVEDGQADRPEGAAQVAGVGDERVRDPHADGVAVQRAHGTSGPLHQERGDGGDGGQHQEGGLLQERPRQRADRALAQQRHALQRPGVEQDHDERQADEHGLGQQPQGEQHERAPRLPARASPGPARIGEQGQEAQERAQQLLALGHPGHGFDAGRMDREERRHQRAGPERAGQGPQGQEQHRRVGRVQDQVRQVVAPGLGAPQRHVRHVAEPRQRVPVGGVAARERPGGGGRGQAAQDRAVGGDVLVVVVHQEPVAQRGQERQEGQRRQRGRHGERPAVGKHRGWRARS